MAREAKTRTLRLEVHSGAFRQRGRRFAGTLVDEHIEAHKLQKIRSTLIIHNVKVTMLLEMAHVIAYRD